MKELLEDYLQTEIETYYFELYSDSDFHIDRMPMYEVVFKNSEKKYVNLEELLVFIYNKK